MALGQSTTRARREYGFIGQLGTVAGARSRRKARSRTKGGRLATSPARSDLPVADRPIHSSLSIGQQGAPARSGSTSRTTFEVMAGNMDPSCNGQRIDRQSAE